MRARTTHAHRGRACEVIRRPATKFFIPLSAFVVCEGEGNKVVGMQLHACMYTFIEPCACVYGRDMQILYLYRLF